MKPMKHSRLSKQEEKTVQESDGFLVRNRVVLLVDEVLLLLVVPL